MPYAYLSLGSNLGDRVGNIKKAIEEIGKIAKIIKISPFYITQPMYYKDQPYFINAAIKIETKLQAKKLLKRLLKIEERMGRVRSFKNAPRIIDIDIVYYDQEIINSSLLKIPHPLRLERLFVLKPLSDIQPQLKDPITKKTISHHLKKLKDQFILKIPKNYREAVNFLLSLKPREKNDIKTDYVKQNLKDIGEPHKELKNIIHITGSVGKTSTAFYISKILSKMGFSTALYTSPHIKDIRERIILNNKMISKREFLKILVEILSKSTYLCSVFEYLTLIAIKFFSDKNPDFSIIEVGMGGLNDATNVFEKNLAVVFTPITKEHTRYLGKDLKDITLNKSGIIKEGSKVFISSKNKKVVINTIKKMAKEKNAQIHILHDGYREDVEKENFYFAKWICQTILNRKLEIEFFPIQLLARLYKIKYHKREILLDGAHTLLSIKRLLKSIEVDKYKICLCSFMKDKDYKRSLREIVKKDFKKIIITNSLSPRSFNIDDIEIKDPRISKEKDIAKAFKKAISLGDVLVCGSLYLCGDILALIRKEKRVYLAELI